MIWNILGAVVSGVSSYFERRQRIAEVKVNAEAKIEEARANAEVARLSKLADAEIAWDQAAVDQMRFSWKDEYFVIVWTAPLWLAMLPFEYTQRASAAFFQMMDHAPDWYVYGMGVMIAASFGIRKVAEVFQTIRK